MGVAAARRFAGGFRDHRQRGETSYVTVRIGLPYSNLEGRAHSSHHRRELLSWRLRLALVVIQRSVVPPAYHDHTIYLHTEKKKNRYFPRFPLNVPNAIIRALAMRL